MRHVGDMVAFVVADTLAQARDAAEAIVVEYENLPAVNGITAAMKPGAPLVWPQRKGNIVFDAEMGSKEKAEAGFAKADHVTKLKIVNNRLVTNYMETRAVVASHDQRSERFHLSLGSQGVHGIRDVLADAVFKVPKEKVHVTTGDVGGGFGTKAFCYREYPLAAEAAKRVGRPVVWIGDRAEHFLGDSQGRDHITEAELALDRKGRILGLKIDVLSDMGAYLSAFAPFIPSLAGLMAPGLYDIPGTYFRFRGLYSNTLPVDAYRGAGRPEAAYLIERLVDLAAREMGLSPDKIRARNFIKPKQMPYKTAMGRVYDLGEFEGHLNRAMEVAGWASFKERLRASRKRGMIRGIGLASYIEICAFGAAEDAVVRIEKDGSATILVGTQSNGQGHATAYAQIASQHLDLPLERIGLVQGDSDQVKTGGGTGGSRSIPVGGAAVAAAATLLVDKLKGLAAQALEAAPGDLEVVDGTIRVVGTDKAIGYAQIAALPGVKASNLSADGNYLPAGRHLPERHAYLRGRDRSRDRQHEDPRLHHRRRFRRGAQSAPPRGPGAWRHHARHRPGAPRAHRLRRGWPARHRFLHGLCGAARRGHAELRFRDAQRALHHQRARREGRGRSRHDRGSGHGDECRRRRARPCLRHSPYRHAGDTASRSTKRSARRRAPRLRKARAGVARFRARRRKSVEALTGRALSVPAPLY